MPTNTESLFDEKSLTGVPVFDLTRVTAVQWRKSMLKTVQLFAVAAAIFFTASHASAQNYPSKPIQMIIPFAAGGTTDLMARALQDELSKELKVPIVIVNRGGAGATIGVSAVARSPTDGYTIGLTTNNPLSIQPLLSDDVSYSLDSFRYICQVYDNPLALIVGAGASFKTFPEFVAFANSKPRALLYGTLGPGSAPHIVMLKVLEAARIKDAVDVPYPGASGAQQAILSGAIMAYVGAPANAKASDLPVLAVFAKERIPALPDVPTIGELGYPINALSAGGLIVPKDTPDDIVKTLEQACAKATTSQPFRTSLEKLDSFASYRTGKEFEQFLRQDMTSSIPSLKATGLTK